MKVMVMVKASKDSEAGVMPSEQLLTEMGKFNQELIDAGILLAAEGLHPTSKGVRVKFSGKNRAVTDGPFTETKELLAGFWLWRVKSMEDAINWVKRCPNPHEEECEVEIRPIFEADDFGESLTPELREQEAAMRAQSLGLGSVRFENAPERIVAGIDASYTPETKREIAGQWERFVPSMGKVPAQVGTDAYGVCWNSKPDCGFHYLTGVEVSQIKDLPADFRHVTIPSKRYAVVTHSKHISEIGNTIESIWSKWLPDAGVKTASAPWFERYTTEFNPKTGLGGTEIWIPLEG
jgi:predicted transcriptional regulator YdeE